jgi:hypothetical protein
MTAEPYSAETYLERIERLVAFEGWDQVVAEAHIHTLAARNRQELWEQIRMVHYDSAED